MGVDVVDVVDADPGVLEGQQDRSRRLLGLRVGSGDVEGVGGRGAAQHPAEDGGAPLAAPASDSSTITPAPSPITKPSRSASKGREIPSCESAPIAANDARASGVSVASAPPVTTISASPERISRAAVPIACDPAAQAETTP